MDEIVDLIGHFFFENIMVQNPEHEELLNLFYLLLEKEINNLNEPPNINEFLENSFISRLLKNLCKRSDVKNYLSLTFKDLIMKLESLSENFMEIDINLIFDKIKNSVNDEFLFSNKFLEKTKLYCNKNKNDGLSFNLHNSTITSMDFQDESVLLRNKNDNYAIFNTNSNLTGNNSKTNSFSGSTWNNPFNITQEKDSSYFIDLSKYKRIKFF